MSEKVAEGRPKKIAQVCLPGGLRLSRRKPCGSAMGYVSGSPHYQRSRPAPRSAVGGQRLWGPLAGTLRDLSSQPGTPLGDRYKERTGRASGVARSCVLIVISRHERTARRHPANGGGPPSLGIAENGDCLSVAVSINLALL